MASLSQILDDPSRKVVFAGYGMDGHFIAEVLELEGGVKTSVYPRNLYLLWRRLLHRPALWMAAARYQEQLLL